jgi:serine/threonine protein kinase
MQSVFSPIAEDRQRYLPSGIPVIKDTDILAEPSGQWDSPHLSLVASKLILGLRRMQDEFGGNHFIDMGVIAPGVEKSEVVGEGCFGKVLKGTYDGERVAVKILKIPEHSKNSRSAHTERELLIGLSCELSVLKHFGESHPNLVHFKGAIAAGGHMMMVMGLADRGNLRTVLQDPRLTWKLKLGMACGIANGLQALHEMGLIHRDIKDTNVLVDTNYNCLICDHGFIIDAECDSRLETRAGTTHFMAPEMELGSDYDELADCFSLGITFCGMAAGKVPVETDFLMRTPRNNFEFVPDEFCGVVPHDCPQSFVDLCVQCCAFEPEVCDRVSCSTLTVHVWGREWETWVILLMMVLISPLPHLPSLCL